MRKNKWLSLTLLAFPIFIVLSTVRAQEPAAPAAPKSHRMPMMRVFSYTCEGGAKVIVLLREKSARVHFGDKVYFLKQVEGASGAKYSDGSIVWWTKGDEGFLEDEKNPDKPERLASNCKLEPAPPPAVPAKP